MTNDDSTQDGQAAGVTRRQLLRGGMAVGGAAVVWAAPVVSGVGLTAAHAAPPSPQVLGEETESPSPSPTVQGVTITKPKLPFTGSGLPVDPTLAVATGLVAVGGAAYAASKMRRHKLADGAEPLLAESTDSAPGSASAPGPDPEPPAV